MIKDDFTDHLNRKALAEKVLNKLLKEKQVKVMSLNGGWGSGKTYFLEFMAEHSKNKNILFLTHNVWENDYLDDPFLSIMAELLEKLEAHKTLFVKAGELSLETLRAFFDRLHSAIQVEATGEVGISIPFLAGAKIETKVDLSKLILPQKPELKDYEKLKKAKKDFKEALGKIISGLPNKKLVIAIDELDRTRPEYAIRTLEVIKHFLDIDGLKFILAVDKKQLQNTVKQMFGQDTETDCYLRKFVDIEWNLPTPDLKSFIDAQLVLFKNVFPLHQNYVYFEKTASRAYFYTFINGKTDLQDKVLDALVAFFQSQSMSLRDIEKFLIRLKITLEGIPEDETIALDTLLELLLLNKKQTVIFQKTYAYITSKHKDNVTFNLLAETDSNNRRTYFSQDFRPFFTDYKNESIMNDRLGLMFSTISNAISKNEYDKPFRFVFGDLFIPPSDLDQSAKGSFLNLSGTTLLHYYQAIQFAGDFNKDDSEAGTT